MEETLIKYEDVEIEQNEQPLLEHVNLELHKGEFVFLIGKVGTGKTSLLKTMYSELEVVSGHAEVLGNDMMTIKRKNIPQLRRRLGIIFQDFQLLTDRTVFLNLAFVLKATGWKDKAEIDERIDEVLNDVGLLEKKESMPHELSGGEQQRIAIARAILNRPKMIIADEPTGNLDPETASYIVNLLKNVTKTGTAVVMSTHNIPMLDKYPGIVYRCKDGHINDVTKEYSKIDLTEDGEEN